jgi:hypothetical protein
MPVIFRPRAFVSQIGPDAGSSLFPRFCIFSRHQVGSFRASQPREPQCNLHLSDSPPVLRTALRVPAARSRPGVAHFLHRPDREGRRSAQRRPDAAAPGGHAMTQHARRLARAPCVLALKGRAPLGAPPRRFVDAVPRFRRPAFPPAIRAANSSRRGSYCPAGGFRNSRACGCEPQPRDAEPRSAFRIASGDAPHEQGCSFVPPSQYVVNKNIHIVRV